MNGAAVKHFLVIDDDRAFAEVLLRSLQRKSFRASLACTADGALQQLTAAGDAPITHVVLDMKLAETTGLQLLPRLLAQQPDLNIVILTGYASVATTVEAIKQGAINYLCKPASTEEILAAFDDDRGDSDDALPDESPLSVDRMEWEYIQRQLQAHHGNIAATARALGMHRRTLQRKLQKRPGKL